MPEAAILPKEVERRLTDACRRRLPNETCGILFGTEAGAQVEVEEFAVIRNAARRPGESFAFLPEDWVSAYYEAQKNQRKIVGFFHSHPDGRPLPSVKDAKGWLPWGTYWIVGFSQHDSEIAAYTVSSAGDWRSLTVRAG
ncbi:M67 family metallopeptidase [Cohnella pontilimi]|uniref:M67 family metallopeptidase n=1 Tax=Cohnella pontilimi TaxID=2564100 RepID=A0A4U0FA30_9BACL|nr:M67 family metallopeptidase [Cohnella pontilimi]TJY41378.1 M67 family metallopeptidase [Cohnella pontilimi]